MTQRFKLVKQYPAVKIVTFADGVEPKVYDGEILTDENGLESWKLGSVVGYAIENGKDPIAAYSRAVERKEETHYAFSTGACLTAEPRMLQNRIAVKYGQEIIFQGQRFIVQKAANHNIDLIPVK